MLAWFAEHWAAIEPKMRLEEIALETSKANTEEFVSMRFDPEFGLRAFDLEFHWKPANQEAVLRPSNQEAFEAWGEASIPSASCEMDDEFVDRPWSFDWMCL
jgi:hypothetical protein